MDDSQLKNVKYSVFDEEHSFKPVRKNCRLEMNNLEKNNLQLFVLKKDETVADLCLSAINCTLGRVGSRGLTIYHMGVTHLLTFPTEECFLMAHRRIQNYLLGADVHENTNSSVFKKRTLEWSAVQYFQFYSYLSQQQNMMQDYIRTSTYQKAVFANTIDFKNKVVLDVGAGSGILSFFAVQGGARKVYAVEASNMAQHCQNLVRSNKLTKKITVIEGKIEEISLPEKVDIIVSEPMGYMLVNERMLETYIHAKKFLKPNGRMYPTFANLYAAPFTDDALYQEQFTKANFWYQPSFHGVDLTGLRDASLRENFNQPVVDTFDVSICMAGPCRHTINFLKASEEELCNIQVPLEFITTQAGTIHGLAFWFDVCFDGSQTRVWLSTSPTEPLTHWYQVRCLLTSPLFVQEGQRITGLLLMYANAKQSYDVEIRLEDEEMNRVSNRLDLKNPCFRYTGANYSSSTNQSNSNVSPTEAFFDSNNMCAPGTSNTNNSNSNGVDHFPPLTSRLPSTTQNGPMSSCIGSTTSVSPQFMIGDYAAAAGGGIAPTSLHLSGNVSSSSSAMPSASSSGLVPHAAGVSIQPTTRGFHSVHMPISTAPMPY